MNKEFEDFLRNTYLCECGHSTFEHHGAFGGPCYKCVDFSLHTISACEKFRPTDEAIAIYKGELKSGKIFINKE